MISNACGECGGSIAWNVLRNHFYCLTCRVVFPDAADRGKPWVTSPEPAKFKPCDRVVVDGVRGVVLSTHILRNIKNEADRYMYAVTYDDGTHGCPTEDRMKPEPVPKAGACNLCGGPVVTTTTMSLDKSTAMIRTFCQWCGNRPCDPYPFVYTNVSGNGLAVSRAAFDRMVAGREYLHTDGRFVVRKHQGRLIGRKLETFHKLSELE